MYVGPAPGGPQPLAYASDRRARPRGDGIDARSEASTACGNEMVSVLLGSEIEGATTNGPVPDRAARQRAVLRATESRRPRARSRARPSGGAGGSLEGVGAGVVAATPAQDA